MKINCSYINDCLNRNNDCDMCTRNSLYTHWTLGDQYHAEKCNDCQDNKYYEVCEDNVCNEYHNNYEEE